MLGVFYKVKRETKLVYDLMQTINKLIDINKTFFQIIILSL